VEQSKAFREAKRLLTSVDVLIHYSSDKPLVLSVDASSYGVGAVLSHIMEDGSQRPIAFASRSLKPAERNYAQIDREGLAIIFGMKHCHQYVWGRKVEIHTDHKPLLGLLGEDKPVPHLASPRVIRWCITLSAYTYTLRFKPGKAHGNCDALSRLPLPDGRLPDAPKVPEFEFVRQLMDNLSEPITASQIRVWTRKDPLLCQVYRYVQTGWPDKSPSDELLPFFRRRTELSIDTNGECIMWGNRVIVPKPGRAQLLEELHETHPGVVRMKGLARSYFWWPNLCQDIESVVHRCNSCQMNARNPPIASLHPWELPARPWQRLHVDYAGPFMGRMFFVAADAFSKFVEIRIVASNSASTNS